MRKNKERYQQIIQKLNLHKTLDLTNSARIAQFCVVKTTFYNTFLDIADLPTKRGSSIRNRPFIISIN